MQIMKLQPFLEKLFFISSDYLYWLLHNPIFLTWVSETYNRFIEFGGLYLRFSQCDLNQVFSLAHTFHNLYDARVHDYIRSP